MRRSDQPILDTYITAKVKGAKRVNEKLFGAWRRPNGPVTQINVNTRQGSEGAEGAGTVADKMQKDHIEKVVGSLNGVKKFVSRIKVKS